MSIRIMSMVWERYGASGGHLLLALALADHARDDGTHIYPSVNELANKTRQSVRTVQYQLQRMLASGWLIKCNAGDGGRGRTVVYRISPDWLKGANLAPFSADEDGAGDADQAGGDAGDDGQNQRNGGPPEPVSGAENGATAAAGFEPDQETERVQTEAQKGAIAVAPAIEPYEPSCITPLPPQGEKVAELDEPEVPCRESQAGARPRKLKAIRQPIEIRTYLDRCKASGVKAIPEGASVLDYVDRVGIPREVFLLHWAEFKLRHIESRRRYKDWLRTLLNSVRGNWYGLWVLNPSGGCSLTTKGVQAQRFHETDGGGA
jgi:hypothetical protein